MKTAHRLASQARHNPPSFDTSNEPENPFTEGPAAEAKKGRKKAKTPEEALAVGVGAG